MIASTSKSSMTRKFFFLGMILYALAWTVILIVVNQTFGSGVIILLALIFTAPLLFTFVTAARMQRQLLCVRRREFVFLTILAVILLCSGGYTVWYFHNLGMDAAHAERMKYEELVRIARSDAAFYHVKFSIAEEKQGGYSCYLNGTVSSQDDLDRLKALGKSVWLYWDTDGVVVEKNGKNASPK
jgi:hypothetical protein